MAVTLSNTFQVYRGQELLGSDVQASVVFVQANVIRNSFQILER